MKARSARTTAAAVLTAALVIGAGGCFSKPVNLHETAQPVAHQDSGNGGAAEVGSAAPSLRLEHGVPVGWPLTQAGAEGAASAFVRATSLVARSGPLTRRDVVLTLATTASGPALVSSVNDELDGLTVGAEGRSVSPGELMWAEYPLTVTSAMTSDTDRRGAGVVGHGRRDPRRLGGPPGVAHLDAFVLRSSGVTGRSPIGSTQSDHPQ